MKIAILSSAHKHNDDRLFYHFSKSLSQKGHKVYIITGDCDLETKDTITISSFNGKNYSKREKIETYVDKLFNIVPDTIICLEPITIIAAKKYSGNKNTPVIYDITEWYPSKSILQNHLFILKPFYFILYSMLFIYSCFLADGFIYGEYYKGLLPKKLFPKKKNIQISYYPKKEYFTIKKPSIKSNSLRLCYSGKLNEEKGLINFINVLQELLNTNNKLQIQVQLIGESDPTEKDNTLKLLHELDKNIHVSFFGFQELEKYIQLINNTDIFLDLRAIDLVNSHSLPIKLFYFMALQRPVIYSDLKSIRKKVEINNCGYLVDPKNTKKIAELISNYQNDDTLYSSHCTNAKELFTKKYNWSILEKTFISFIENFKFS